MKHLYDRLELPQNATLAQIKRAYRKLALKYHPDRNSNPNAVETFMEIDAAYDTLVEFKKTGRAPIQPTFFSTASHTEKIKKRELRLKRRFIV